MICQCFQIGGPFIAEDPDCPAHGHEAVAERERQEVQQERMERELSAWRTRFADFTYVDQNGGTIQQKEKS